MLELIPILAAVFLGTPAVLQDDPDDPEAGQDGEDPDDEEGDEDDEDDEDAGDEAVLVVPGVDVEIREPRPRAAATERQVEREVLETYPHRDADELLRMVPGMHLSAHGGRGKAHQIFVRGFDAVHGSDVAISVEGIPLNEVSNVHGQGYLDLHFLPPTAIRSMQWTKGAVRADRGDFAVAASADLSVGVEEPGVSTGVGVGTDRSLRVTTAVRPPGSGPGSFVAGDAEFGDGVGEQREFERVRFLGGVGGDVGDGVSLRWLAGAYHGRFESPGVLREDDLEAGRVALYDAYLDWGGGSSSRLITALSLDAVGMAGRGGGMLYAGYRELTLERNFTGWLLDEEHGDFRRQQHEAVTFGGRATYKHSFLLFQDATSLEGGLSFRGDALQQSDRGVDQDGVVHTTDLDAQVLQLNPSAWLSADVGLFERVRVVPGVRLDVLGYRVRHLVDGEGLSVANPEHTWTRAVVLSPKAALDVRIARGWHGYLSYGRGFRSPEARGLDGGVAPVTKADTLEVGTVLTAVPWLDVEAAFFATAVSNEIVFDHVSARYLSSGATRRLGGELVTAVNPLPWLRGEVSVTYADGRYTATGEPIPYAPRWLVDGGIYVSHHSTVRRGPRAGLSQGIQAGLHSWVLGPRPLPEDQRSHTAWVTDLMVRLELGAVYVEIQVDNLFAQRWRDGEFLFPSWFDRSTPRSQLPVRQITAGTPQALRLLVGAHVPPPGKKEKK